ncbi:ankyrin repeat domain-containing protein [Clostridium sp. 'deep sea']|uniref:ankyrin repeat domain-containing protein n=1 Tax=Clostridium sp. 'deep sea' TaxID=2779445 RepID=UPI0018964F56|nr:ankyrin repeat domain-containing protein [Clostridium sp. 'deep sea']QOR35635.1 ankyrin repeat domain-containing protein [Clostridium sp. 'deep sea']
MKNHITSSIIFVILIISLLTACQPSIESQLQTMGYQYNKESFFKSIKQCDIGAVKLFIEDGFDVNIFDSKNKSLLYYAVDSESEEIVNLLIENGANINSSDCPLEAACKRINLTIVKLLLNNGARLDLSPKPLNAIITRNIAIAELLLKNGADPNYFCTPMAIELATQDNYTEMIKLLIKYGAELNNIANPLNEAIQKNNIKITKLLLDSGADPNNALKKLPLQSAIDNNNLEIFNLLVEYGADVNKIKNSGFYHKDLFNLGYMFNEDNYIKSLHDGNYEAIKLFLIEGFDPNLEINYDRFPIIVATEKQRKDLITLLLDYGANINICGFYLNTALYEAVSSENIEIIQYLIEKGANPSDGIACAVSKDNIDLVKYFLNLGANPNAGFPASAFIIATEKENYEMMELLLFNGADIEDKVESNYANYSSALEIATYNNKLELVQFLVENGANYERCLTNAIAGEAVEAFHYFIHFGADPNKSGDLPLPICQTACMGNIEFLDILLKNGAEIDKYATNDPYRTTAISEAAKNDYLDIVKFLVKNGADIHRTDAATPLVTAAEMGRIEVVKYLLEQGVDINIKNHLGKTALEVAKSYRQQVMIDFLESYAK